MSSSLSNLVISTTSASLSNLAISTTSASLSHLVSITSVTSSISATSSATISSSNVTFLTILAPTPTVTITRPGIATASLHHAPLPTLATLAISVASANYSTLTGKIKEGPTSMSLVMSRTPVESVVSSRTPVVSVISSRTPVPDNIIFLASFVFPHH